MSSGSRVKTMFSGEQVCTGIVLRGRMTMTGLVATDWECHPDDSRIAQLFMIDVSLSLLWWYWANTWDVVVHSLDRIYGWDSIYLGICDKIGCACTVVRLCWLLGWKKPCVSLVRRARIVARTSHMIWSIELLWLLWLLKDGEQHRALLHMMMLNMSSSIEIQSRNNRLWYQTISDNHYILQYRDSIKEQQTVVWKDFW